MMVAEPAPGVDGKAYPGLTLPGTWDSVDFLEQLEAAPALRGLHEKT